MVPDWKLSLKTWFLRVFRVCRAHYIFSHPGHAQGHCLRHLWKKLFFIFFQLEFLSTTFGRFVQLIFSSSESVPMFGRIPSSDRDGVNTIGKSIKNYGDPYRVWFIWWTWSPDELGQRGSGTPWWMKPLGAIWRPPVTWRKVIRTIRRPKSVCLDCSLFEIKDSSISSSTEATSDWFRFARQNSTL